MMRRSVLIVDSDPSHTIRKLISRTGDSRLEIVAEAPDGVTGYALALSLRPDLVIIRLEVPGIQGAVLAHLVDQSLPDSVALVVTSTPDPRAAHVAMSLGAEGFFVGNGAGPTLPEVAKEVLLGRTYVAAILLAGVQELEWSTTPPRELQLLARFTPREREILALICAGLTAREGAEVLSISPRTVEGYRESIKKKLGVKRRVEVVAVAAGAGLLPLTVEGGRPAGDEREE